MARLKAAWLVLRGKPVIFRVKGELTLRADATVFFHPDTESVRVHVAGGGGSGGGGKEPLSGVWGADRIERGVE